MLQSRSGKPNKREKKNGMGYEDAWTFISFDIRNKQKFCKLCRVPLVISIWEKWSRLHLRLKNFTEELSMSRALGHCSLTNITGPLSPRALRLDSCFHIINIVCLCLTVTRDLKLWLELSCARSCPGFFYYNPRGKIFLPWSSFSLPGVGGVEDTWCDV